MLANEYFNIGCIYLEKGNRKESEDYLILAGYLVISLNMKNLLSQMSWALNPVLNKLGREDFMRRGKELAEEYLSE